MQPNPYIDFKHQYPGYVPVCPEMGDIFLCEFPNINKTYYRSHKEDQIKSITRYASKYKYNETIYFVNKNYLKIALPILMEKLNNLLIEITND